MNRRRGDLLGFSREQIQGGLVLPALVGTLTWMLTTHAIDARQDQLAADAKDAKAAAIHARDRELDVLDARVGALERRCGASGK